MADFLAENVAYVLASCGARRKIARIKKQGRSTDILVANWDLERLVAALEKEHPGLLDRFEARFREAAT